MCIVATVCVIGADTNLNNINNVHKRRFHGLTHECTEARSHLVLNRSPAGGVHRPSHATHMVVWWCAHGRLVVASFYTSRGAVLRLSGSTLRFP